MHYSAVLSSRHVLMESFRELSLRRFRDNLIILHKYFLGKKIVDSEGHLNLM